MTMPKVYLDIYGRNHAKTVNDTMDADSLGHRSLLSVFALISLHSLSKGVFSSVTVVSTSSALVSDIQDSRNCSATTASWMHRRMRSSSCNSHCAKGVHAVLVPELEFGTLKEAVRSTAHNSVTSILTGSRRSMFCDLAMIMSANRKRSQNKKSGPDVWTPLRKSQQV